jgi:DnaK suppressor protein
MKLPVEIRKQPNVDDRRALLQAKIVELTGVFHDRSGLAIENSADVLDTIRMATDRDVLVQRMNLSARLLSDVRLALHSLDTGDYGVCEDCEEPISAPRLNAIPWARLCVKCQEARDRRDVGLEDDGLAVAA